MYLRSFAMLALLALDLSGAQAGVIASSSFDTYDQGWGVATVDPFSGYAIQTSPLPTYTSTGGNPSGYISILDPDNWDTFFLAPIAYQGNLLNALNGTLQYDIITDQPPDYNGADVVIKGNGVILVYDIPVPPQGQWTTTQLTLAPGANWHLTSQGGAAPTLTDFQTALSNVDFFAITAEYHVGPTETSGLDNVILSDNNVPEPSSFLLTLPVLAAAFQLRRRAIRR